MTKKRLLYVLAVNCLFWGVVGCFSLLRSKEPLLLQTTTTIEPKLQPVMSLPEPLLPKTTRIDPLLTFSEKWRANWASCEEKVNLKSFVSQCPTVSLPEGIVEDCLRFGTKYAGFLLPSSFICWAMRLERPLIVYSFGVGEDMSFDLALRSSIKFPSGIEYHLFDPTPRAIEHYKQVQYAIVNRRIPQEGSAPARYIPAKVEGSIENVELNVGGRDAVATEWFRSVLDVGIKDENPFVYHPWALWTEDTSLVFEAPKSGVSHRLRDDVTNVRTNPGLQVSARSIASIMSELKHHHGVDILKFDIEGAEKKVVPMMLANFLKTDPSRRTWPKLIMFDMDCHRWGHPSYDSTCRAFLMGEFIKAGYTFFQASDGDYTFCLV